MFKKVLKFFWSLRQQLAKYFIVGSSGVILDMATLILLKEMFGLLPIVAVIINQALLLVYIFLLNKYWTFKNKEIPHKQIVRFAVLMGFNYVFSVLTMYIFNHRLEYDYRVVRISTIAISTTWNFFLYKYWVYRTFENKISEGTPRQP